jgi:hypothetical protein
MEAYEKSIIAYKWNYCAEKCMIFVDIGEKTEKQQIPSRHEESFDFSTFKSKSEIIACKIDQYTKFSSKVWHAWWNKEPIEIISHTNKPSMEFPKIREYQVKEVLPKSNLVFKSGVK